MNKFKEEAKKYLDEYGLYQDTIGNHSGNSLLFTAHYALALLKNGQLTHVEADELSKALKSCELEPGLFQRHPTSFVGDQEGIDDYIGASAASFYVNLDHFFPDTRTNAKEILDFGRSGRYKFFGIEIPYYYPNHDPYKTSFNARAWLGRYPALIAHLKFCAGEYVNSLLFIYWAASIILGLFQNLENKDSRLLSLHMIHVAIYAKPDNILVTLLYKFFYWKVKRDYGSIQEVFRRYFTDPNQPLIKWSL